MTHPELTKLREELRQVDVSILETIARRKELVSRIGRVKEDAGIATRDFNQEKAVIGRARAVARSLGVNEDLAEDVVVRLIRSSLKVQESQRVQAEGDGAGKTALVIGGSGKMGAWFVRFLTAQGYSVSVADPLKPVVDIPWCADWREDSLEEDVIVVAAPLGHTVEVLVGLAERKPSGLVFDVGSLKTPLRQGLLALKEAGVMVTSVHPMFGPDTELLSGKHILFIDLGNKEATARARVLFESTMAQQMEMGLDEHDRLIAYILGLSHAVNIAFFTALSKSAEDAPRLAMLSSTTFQAQLGVAARVASENPRLYYEIQALNEFGMESLEGLSNAVEGLKDAIATQDEERFVAMMESGARYLSDVPL